jgi:DNA-binding IclR family transcriptional regulator
MRSFTARTITSRDELEKELTVVRSNGYAIDNEEIQIGLRCVAAPIFDYRGYPAAAISVSKHLNTLTVAMQELIARDIVGIARQISYRLGHGVGG